jgi:hypothetical protein
MTEILPPLEKGEVHVEDDYQHARENLIGVIDKGNEALEALLQIAQQSQQPRAFEVVASLIKTVAEANKDLLEIAKKTKEIENMDGNNSAKTINNNLFVGSTAELQKLLKKTDEQQD